MTGHWLRFLTAASDAIFIEKAPLARLRDPCDSFQERSPSLWRFSLSMLVVFVLFARIISRI